MGGSSSKSDSEQDSSFNQNVWSGQSGALSNLYNNMGNLFNQTNTTMQNQIPGATDYMNQVTQQSMPGWQDAMQGGVYKDMGLQDNLMNSLNQSMNSPSAMQDINSMIMGGDGNNYADAMRDQYVQDASRAQGNMLQNLDARAAASGMSGGSRHGLATAQGMDDINRNLQSNMAQTGFNTFDKDLDRKLSIAQQADQGTLARQGMMQDMLGQQQSTQAGGLQYGNQMQNLGMGQFAPSMTPWNAASSYANTIGRPTVLGSGISSGDSSSKASSGGIGGGKG